MGQGQNGIIDINDLLQLEEPNTYDFDYWDHCPESLPGGDDCENCTLDNCVLDLPRGAAICPAGYDPWKPREEKPTTKGRLKVMNIMREHDIESMLPARVNDIKKIIGFSEAAVYSWVKRGYLASETVGKGKNRKMFITGINWEEHHGVK